MATGRVSFGRDTNQSCTSSSGLENWAAVAPQVEPGVSIGVEFEPGSLERELAVLFKGVMGGLVDLFDSLETYSTCSSRKVPIETLQKRKTRIEFIKRRLFIPRPSSVDATDQPVKLQKVRWRDGPVVNVVTEPYPQSHIVKAIRPWPKTSSRALDCFFSRKRGWQVQGRLSRTPRLLIWS